MDRGPGQDQRAGHNLRRSNCSLCTAGSGAQLGLGCWDSWGGRNSWGDESSWRDRKSWGGWEWLGMWEQLERQEQLERWEQLEEQELGLLLENVLSHMPHVLLAEFPRDEATPRVLAPLGSSPGHENHGNTGERPVEAREIQEKTRRTWFVGSLRAWLREVRAIFSHKLPNKFG